MTCFYFFSKEKNEEQKTTKSIFARTSSTTTSISRSTDQDTKKFGSEFNSQNTSELSTESSSKNSFAALSQRQSNLRDFTFTELKSATKNFSRSTMIGEGGFGGVYKGVIRSAEDRQKKINIAVKQLNRSGLQGHKEWVTEVNVLGVVEHPNLVKLIGYCAEDDERGSERLLIYEYMPNGSVQDHLSSRSKTSLPWSTRIKIAQDTARGLAYLHEGMDFQIIFRDFKSSNILLDEEWNAKLSDFGLARLGPSDGVSHVSTGVVGTLGYAAPEYMQTGHLTSKSDVWSYGVFLYELITGRQPLDYSLPRKEQNLLKWIGPHLSSNLKKFRLILDPRLELKSCLKSAHKLARVANKCLTGNAKARPKMSEVVEMVSRIVEAAETGSPQPSVKSLRVKDGEELSKSARLKGRFLEMIYGKKGCLIMQSVKPKLVKTC